MKRKRFKHGICPALPMRKNKKKLKKESCCLRYLYSQSCSLFDNRKKRFIDDEIKKIKKALFVLDDVSSVFCAVRS